MAADLLTTIRSELDARLRDLRPLLSEYERLLAAVQALDVAGSSPAPKAVDASTAPAPSAAPVRRRGRPRGSAAGAIKRAASSTSPAPIKEQPAARTERSSGSDGVRAAERTPKRERAPRGAARQAIVAALEHGSHTVAELVMVTAMTGPNITINIRRLLAEGTIGKTSREGKTAYTLPSALSEG